MLLKIDFESDIPIYLQLKNQIIEGIATGSLKQGEALPSVRQMASDLGINLHTVNKAYTNLKQDGFITVHRKKGVVVNGGRPPNVTEEYSTVLKDSLQPIITEAYCRGMDKKSFIQICEELFLNLEKKGVE